MNSTVHPAVRACVTHLSQPKALKEEGLFRVNGSRSKMAPYLRMYGDGKLNSFPKHEHGSVVCSLLKQILVERELPLGLQLSRLLEMSIVTGKLAGLTEAELAKAAQDILMMGNQEQRETLYALVVLLERVAQEPANLMDLSSLGTALSPTIFPGVIVTNSQTILEFLAKHKDVMTTPAGSIKNPSGTVKSF
eukprot:m.129560 g.129560  ORF g.129560 m.129560 type:complete len:192 (+) comp14579_c1_seq2:1793-2368(+)